MDEELELQILMKEAEKSLNEQLILTMIVDYLKDKRKANTDEINKMLMYCESEQEYEIFTKIINKQKLK